MKGKNALRSEYWLMLAVLLVLQRPGFSPYPPPCKLLWSCGGKYVTTFLEHRVYHDDSNATVTM